MSWNRRCPPAAIILCLPCIPPHPLDALPVAQTPEGARQLAATISRNVSRLSLHRDGRSSDSLAAAGRAGGAAGVAAAAPAADGENARLLVFEAQVDGAEQQQQQGEKRLQARQQVDGTAASDAPPDKAAAGAGEASPPDA